MIVSGVLSLQTESAPTDPNLNLLLSKDWVWAGRPPCENLEAGKFYEIESTEEITEFYFAGEEGALRPNFSAWPEAPVHCRPIPKPSFVQEIL